MKVNLNVKYNSSCSLKPCSGATSTFLTEANDLVKDVNFIGLTIFSRRKQEPINLLTLKNIKFPQHCSVYNVSVPQLPQVFTVIW